ncbi:MAG: hypothetical protein H8E44_38725 [Planctomycetes bacterium]|nr:hypothetical protein [Planctomycetota bacterium]
MLPNCLLAAVVLVTALSGTFCFYSVVATWAGISPRHWFQRSIVVVAALMLLLPIRAYEALVFFSILSATVAVGVRSARKRPAPGDAAGDRSDLPSARHWLQFRLSDLFLVVLLAGIITAAVVHVFRETLWCSWWDMVLTSVSSAFVALAAVWFVFGQRRLVWRCVLIIGSTAAMAASWTVGDWLGVADWLPVDRDLGLLYVPCSLWLVIWLLLRFGCVSPVNWPTSAKSKPAKPWSRWTSRILLPTFTVLTGCPIGWIYVQLARPLPTKVLVTADPNGFDDLMRAGTSLVNTQVPDAETATTETLEAFIAGHQGELSRMRTALRKPCQVPLDYSPSAMILPRVQRLRSLARLLEADSVLARRQMRFHDAARIGVECSRLADQGSRGGIILDWLVAHAIEDVALRCIAENRHDLTADVCREVISDLEQIACEREPLDQYRQRDEDWERIALGWRHDFWTVILGAAYGLSNDGVPYASMRMQREAARNLLLAELAVRAYRLEHGECPPDLNSLVPDYLADSPVDPFAQQPLRFRVQDGEPLLYSVGTNGVDDGGQRTAWQTMLGGEGDFFLDAALE